MRLSINRRPGTKSDRSPAAVLLTNRWLTGYHGPTFGVSCVEVWCAPLLMKMWDLTGPAKVFR